MINLSETYTYEGHENWETGKKATAQKKIKTGDTVRITFLGASEDKIISPFQSIYNIFLKTGNDIVASAYY